LPSVLPPPDEQRAIARFLEAIDRLTRRYISAQRRLIALLTEQKQALIQQAVTRGLEPNAEITPVEVACTPVTRKRWVTTRLGHFVDILTGFPFPSESFSQDSDDIKLLRGINVAPGGIRWDSTVRWKRSNLENMEEFLLKPGDIVLGLDRPIINLGIRVALVNQEDTPCLLLQRVARLRPSKELDADFLYLLLQSEGFRNYLAPIFTGISVPHISPIQLASFRLDLPPLDVQREIVLWVKAATEKTELAITRTQRQIDLVREYRTRLIADVVTGKLDVRGVALPVEVGRTSESASHLDLEDETDFEKDVEETGSDEEALDE
jgi:type I restriction enzyme S subunit